ncbi:class I SAM-dependent methyltransferase [Streptomyces buecherae]|uniref:class I SAM-dependent methyltransferase n=1 Tax=Streptomyces buecherae TaxID=2763006 RepID=UPI00378E91C0
MADSPTAHGLDGVARTLLTPLYARAHAARFVPESSFRDPLAADLLARTGYADPEVIRDRPNMLGGLHRGMVFDALTEAFVAEHTTATVVSAGIGLCTRNHRLAERAPGVRWVGVDTSEVVALRRRLLPDEDITLRAASITEPDWARGLPGADGPVLVLAEGVLMYLAPDGVRTCLDAIRATFGPGTELAADYFHPKLAHSDRHPIVKATGARFLFGVRNGARLAQHAPGWSLVREHGVMERLNPTQRVAAYAARALTLGGRAYAVAQLRAHARP